MAMMTLLEYAKGMDAGSLNRAYVDNFRQSSDIFDALPFEGLGGKPTYTGVRETGLPTVAFRGINEPGTNGYGTQEEFQEQTYILDHDIDVDEAIIRRAGADRRNREESKGLTAAGKLWTDTFLYGDHASDPREFDGIQARCDRLSHRKLAAGSTSGGDALSLYKLDQAIERVTNPNAILMSHSMFPRLMQAMRNPSISGYIVQQPDQFGIQRYTYAGIPIYFGYKRDRHGTILPYTEANPGGGSAASTSIYILSLGEMGLHGIELSPLTVEDVGLLKTESPRIYRSHVNWDTGIVDVSDYSMVRLWGIKDAAWTA
jgi:hypothetical protein